MAPEFENWVSQITFPERVHWRLKQLIDRKKIPDPIRIMMVKLLETQPTLTEEELLEQYQAIMLLIQLS